MCTVTFLPNSATGFILTSSRDESVNRMAAYAPQPRLIGKVTVWYPEDPQGKGTWIASTTDCTVCLLNGAFTAHHRQPSYRVSRGQVVLDAFRYGSVREFVLHYYFSGIEPFTLVLIENSSLYEFRWDGTTRYVRELNFAKPHIWSSTTLYSPAAITRRQDWFRQWLTTPEDYSLLSIRHFHKTAGGADPYNSLLLNRNGIMRTVSLTSLIRTSQDSKMLYEDLRSGESYFQTIYPSLVMEDL